MSSLEFGVEKLGSIDDGDLVVNDSSVGGVDFVKLSELETGGCFDEVCFGGLGVLISEGSDDDVGEVDELSVDFEDSSGGVELGFDSEGKERERRVSTGDAFLREGNEKLTDEKEPRTP